MKIFYTEDAIFDLDEIEIYICKNSAKNADMVIDKILNAISVLKTLPNSGTLVSSEIISEFEIRKIFVFEYIIFYRVIDEVIYIYRILHGKRDCAKILSKLKKENFNS